MKFYLQSLLLFFSISLFAQKVEPQDTAKILNQVEVKADKSNDFGRNTLKGVDGFGIYEGKKTEIIELSKITANLATNNARQVFAKIPGLNIWESDGAGMQLGIGARGLNPNRTANFNTRQNGYDIAADALGYPESYYTPPIEALERIEIVRGAASLQYGTQFGGMLNFVFKQPDTGKVFSFHTRQTVGSFGFFGSFNLAKFSSKDNRFAGVAMYQRRQGNGWRPNSKFEVNTFYTDLHYHLSSNLTVDFEYTHLNYIAQQAGGLTDAQFAADPRQSVRARNWFAVHWNMPAVGLEYAFSGKTKLKVRGFGLVSDRQALGNLERINVADLGGKRNLIVGDFKNYGAEARLLHEFFSKNGQKQTLLVGARWYDGNTQARQGDGTEGSDANFRFVRPDYLENSDYKFNNKNAAVFAEQIFKINQKFSLTPGIRYEHITTQAAGYYRQTVRNFAGQIVADTAINESKERPRNLILLGIGASWRPTNALETYLNISQNYRAINFTDLRISNPSAAVDPNIQDESGFTADLGVRGNWRNRLNYDVSAFYIGYKNRIGQVLKADRAPLFQDYRYRTNVGNAFYTGIEAYVEADILNFNKKMKSPHALLLFVNSSIIYAKYGATDDASIRGKNVEMAPPLSIRSGLTYSFRQIFKTTFQFNRVQEHFTDATNARQATGAVNGVIPTYSVADLSASWNFWRTFSLDFSCNNVLNQMYFTRRAEAYPGPGIIPSDGRSFFVTFDARF